MRAALLLAAIGSARAQDGWCDIAPQSSWAVCNGKAALDARAADIVSRLSLADKIEALGTSTGPLKSIGLSGYQWWSG